MGMFMRPTDIVTTIATMVEQRAKDDPGRIAYRLARDDASDDRELTYRQLDLSAREVARQLLSQGLSGERVLILCPAGFEYVIALIGCWYAGAIAVPAYPPTSSTLARVMPRIRSIISDAHVKMALVTADVGALLNGDVNAEAFGFATLDVVAGDVQRSRDQEIRFEPVAASSPAIIQYTSGSTSAPKGVVLTHAQVVANLELIQASGRLSEHDVILTWLPPFHDMGLISGVILPLFLGTHSVLIPPEAFIRRPKRWLTVAARYRATALMAPNFAFDLCVERIKGPARHDLDLSSWRIVYNGAEPIHARTLDRFAEAFGPCGFRAEAMYPCYGMAESTLIISGGDRDAPPVVRDFFSEPLEKNRAVRVPSSSSGGPSVAEPFRTQRLVGCGRPLLDETITIVEPDTAQALPSCQVGEIWVHSRSIALGYWNRPEETKRAFAAYTAEGQGPFLRTGDLGFIDDDGELFVTGRLKDLVIIRGRNHYPQDIERTVTGADAALVRDGGVAFAVDGEHGEQLVVVQEFDKRLGSDGRAVMDGIAEAIRREHEIVPASIVLIKRGSLFKTSSGKVQRAATKRAYLAEALQVVERWGLRPDPAHRRDEHRAADREATSAKTETDHERAADRDSAQSRSHLRPLQLRASSDAIVQWLRDHLSLRLKLDRGSIALHEPLAKLGVDSIIAAELTDELEQWLGIELPSTISYDNPTIADLARALASLKAGDRPTPAARPKKSRQALHRSHEPIAIVGMACRLPGAPDLKSFWRLLRQGVDAISEIPPDRWDVASLYDRRPGVIGKMCSKWGGFVEHVERFDAEFFGISAREAARIDPQQRMFLESAWEALEDAGAAPAALARTATGVFAAVSSSDYASLYAGDMRLIDADYGTGNSPSLVANRLSYLLDLKGPSETVDSACSSSLVALAHACRSLRDRDCELAIVGGVNAVLAPEAHVYFSQVRAMATDGRCKTFDRRADGFVRSEGVGVVVLKRLSDALGAHDRIYALVAGGAVNHDGRSNGLLAPNGLAQQALIEQALAAAGLKPSDLDYVEAHGVGTPVADAVELHALAAVMAERRCDHPLLVGSAKTNVGHLEAASGMVSLIKVALALHHEEIPAHLHLREVHPDIGIERLPLEIPTLASPWRRGNRPRHAGVSTFGFGGTNAHVIVSEAPDQTSSARSAAPEQQLLALSAKNPRALRTLAMRYGSQLARMPDDALHAVCFTANAGRNHFEHRIALRTASASHASAQLLSFARGGSGAGLRAGTAKPDCAPAIAFLFSEANVQPGALSELYQTHPTFKAILDRCDVLLQPHLGRSLLEVLYGSGWQESLELLSLEGYADAARSALHWALCTLFRSWGVEPSLVYGSGSGEYAAAAAAQVLPWERAVVLSARRGLLRQSLMPNAQQRLTVRQFKADLAAVSFDPPATALVSASLGREFGPFEAPDLAFFSRHIYHTPQPSDGRAALAGGRCDLQLEFGASVPSPLALEREQRAEGSSLFVPLEAAVWSGILDILARLYSQGANVDWTEFHAPYPQRKLSLPTYPFDRKRHWLDFPERRGERREQPAIEHTSSHPLISRVRVHGPARGSLGAKTAALRNDDEQSGDG
jgi:acyl transferase domain-containing protein/acyl-CoA synthetase (AMP-forming)/AMP-acid ligase II/acyl carrier protein